MRTIKFRGKNTVTGEWEYGYFWKDDICGDCHIREGNGVEHRVDPKTVGQYVCRDVKGNDVYEGDIVRYEYDRRYIETGKIAEHVIERYRVIYSPPLFTFLIRPLVKGAGIDMNACYIEELKMVKEEEE